ncbi:uncharacterized protein LOC111240696 [Vigna radiata var. radiata]|uniref:Uncharacterized protein LOC111240696 n=1 Tax=Vigna radiata var. radiata TaxID=3916 RepID=A0A3Q0EJ02_VIGRR|nr:uncharacterized protein LOC111240696 [Vigna radiata var. radiata]
MATDQMCLIVSQTKQFILFLVHTRLLLLGTISVLSLNVVKPAEAKELNLKIVLVFSSVNLRCILRRFAEEISEYQSRGESKESVFILSYQLAEDLSRAFSERAILKTFMDAESTLLAGSLKVNHIIPCRIFLL